MEKIISQSFTRFKQTALRFFLAYIFGILGFIALTIILAIIAGLGLVIFITTKQYILGVITGVIFFLLALFFYSYLTTWVGLTQQYIIMNPTSLKTVDSYKKTKKLVFSYIIFNIVNSIFLLGILYTNVLFLIPFILWGVWGSFSIYAFLEGHRGGLAPLWYSRSKVIKHFFKVLLYTLVIYVALFLLARLNFQINQKTNYVNILLLLTSPFIASYFYELYLSLPEPKEVIPSKFWLIVSLVGWVLYILIGFSGTTTFLQKFPKNIPNQYRKELKQIQKIEPKSLMNIQLN